MTLDQPSATGDTAPSRTNTVGVVVLYHPDGEIGARMTAALTQVDVLLVVDNTPTAAGPDEAVRSATVPVLPDGAVLIHAGRNIGLGTAYNLAAREALSRGARHLVLLDQDTLVHPNFLAVVAAGASAWHAMTGRWPAVVGTDFANPRDPSPGPPDGASEDGMPSSAVPVDPAEMVVSSGSVNRLRDWATTGGFDDDLFVDYVDIDYCARVRAAGGDVVRVGIVAMTHAMGNTTVHRVAGVRRATSSYPPFRHYYLARNYVLSSRGKGARYALRHGSRRVRFTTLALLFEPGRGATARATAAGLWDGLRHRVGPIPDGRLRHL